MDKTEKIQMFVDDAENLIYICEGASPTPKLDEHGAESRKSEFIWTRKLQSEEDSKATQDLLDFLGTESISKALSEKKTSKVKIWEQVAVHLVSSGYKVAEDMKSASIKCHQKWRNLEKSYNSYVNHNTEICKIPRKPPPHFDRLHAILEKKYLQQKSISTTPTTTTAVLLATGDVLPGEVVVTSEFSAGGISVGEDETLLIDRSNQAEITQELNHGKRNNTKQKTVELEILRTLRQFKQDEEKRFQILQKLLKENLEEKRSLNQAFRQYLTTLTSTTNKRRKTDLEHS